MFAARLLLLASLSKIGDLKQHDNRELKQEEAVKMAQRSTAKFPFKWNRGRLNFNSLAAASS